MYAGVGKHYHADNKCPIQTTCNECHDQAVQLLPSNGWWAWYAETVDGAGHEPSELYKDPLVGWALLRNGTVVPLVNTLDEGVIQESGHTSNFIGVFHENQPAPNLELARDRLAEHARYGQMKTELYLTAAGRKQA